MTGKELKYETTGRSASDRITHWLEFDGAAWRDDVEVWLEEKKHLGYPPEGYGDYKLRACSGDPHTGPSRVWTFTHSASCD